MRHILIDNARRKGRDKRGGDRQRVDLADHADPRQQEADDLLALDEALTRFATADPQAAELVQLHTFGGLSVEEAGQHLVACRARRRIGNGPLHELGCGTCELGDGLARRAEARKNALLHRPRGEEKIPPARRSCARSE